MNLLDAEDDHLAPYADPLLSLSNGKIGDLRGILGLAMIDAIVERQDRGIEIIDSATIQAVGRTGTA